MMKSIGLDIQGSFDQISSATTTGIHSVFQEIPADLAEVSTGAIIKAVTAGRMPLKIADTVSLFFIRSGVRKIAIASIIRNGRMIVPVAAQILPRIPLLVQKFLAVDPAMSVDYLFFYK